jgi:hypothetical protein
LDVVGVHVLEPFLLFPAAGADLFERDRLVVEIGEAARGRQLGERVDEIVVEPDVAPVAVGHVAFEGEHTADHLHGAALTHDARGAVLILRRKAVGPEIGWLDDVIVDGDDQRYFG